MKKKKKVNLNPDFLESALPKNRKELFFDILKNQWQAIIILSLLIFLCCLPLIIFRYSNLAIIKELSSSLNDTNQNEIVMQMKNYYVIESLVNIIMFLIIGVGFSGIMRVFKRLTYGEGIFVGSDFFQGIKENIKEVLMIFLIYGIIKFISDYIAINYADKDQFIYFLLKVINYVFLIPLLFINISLSSIYTDKLRTKMKLSIIIYLKSFYKIFIFFVIAYLLASPLFISTTFMQLFYPMIYSLLFVPLLYLAWVLLANNIFDEMINKISFPEIVNKGLYIEKK